MSLPGREPDPTLAYVRSSAALLSLPLDDERAQRVAQHLARTRGLAELLHHVPLEAHDEPVELYRPAPFPEADAGGAAA